MRLIARLSVLSALLMAAFMTACSSEPAAPRDVVAAVSPAAAHVQATPAGASAATAAMAAAATPAGAPAAAAAPAATASAAAAPAVAAVPSPGVPVTEVHALHNVYRLRDRILSGAAPEGEDSFAELQTLGVKTIVTVDGAAPDIELAAAHGMRYVHIPVSYAEITPAQQLQIAKAIRDLPGPVYVHCHHGKHRGPAAVASAGVELGMLTPAEGVAFMQQAGTAANYTGLYACVEGASVVPDAVFDAMPDDFPSQAEPEGLVAAMVAVDEAWEHLGAIKAAGWAVPQDHPDLVPAAEAGRLTDNLRFGHESAEAKELGADFLQRLAAAQEKAGALEQALVTSAPAAMLDAAHATMSSSCKSCHSAYRDKVR